MVLKQNIETIDLEKERLTLRQDIESYVPERTTFNFTPVTSDEIFETATANVVKNIPAITAVATGASIATAVVAGVMTEGAAFLPAKAAAMFLASKVLPGVMVGAEYVEALWNAKTEPAWVANLNKLTMEEVLGEDRASEFSKGVTESVSLGMAIPKGEETFQRGMGNLAGSIVRDYLVVAGIPIPGKAALQKALGENAVNEILFGIAMTVNNGVEEYNKAINTGHSQDTAYTLGQASMVGNGLGVLFGFGVLPRLQNKLFASHAFGGKTMFGKLTGGLNLLGYDTALKVSGGMVIDAAEQRDGKEITDKYTITAGESLGIFGVGLAFSAVPWSLGKVMGGLGWAAKYPFKKAGEKISKNMSYKNYAKLMAEDIRASYGRTKLNGEFQDILERDFTKSMMDDVILEIKTGIEKGNDKYKMIREVMKKYPGEFTNEKNIRSILEVFSGVI